MIAVVSASLGGFDKTQNHVPQSLPYDNFYFTDENLPPRPKAMTPRLQAKIPKFFGWQLVPGYDYYLWLDGTFTLALPDSLKFFYDNCQGYDITILRHNRRPDVRQEWRYLRKGLRQQSRYLLGRYEGEWNLEQYEAITADPDFKDDLLLNGGVFMYKNTPKVQEAMKEWWYLTTRYTVFDQMALPYALKKFDLKMNILDIFYTDTPYLKYNGHKFHDK